MKNFILGIIVSLIVGTWVTLAVVGIVIGVLIAAWLFGLWWRS